MYRDQCGEHRPDTNTLIKIVNIHILKILIFTKYYKVASKAGLTEY